MALDKLGPKSEEELRDAFNKSAMGGWRYLLTVSATLSDSEPVQIIHLTNAVISEDEIVPMMTCYNRNYNKRSGTTELTGIFDLTRDYDLQKQISGEQQIKALLSPVTLSNLSAMKKSIKLEQQQQAWADRPWYERIFVSKPV